MTLARFTPSLLDGETLERLFVHRHALLDDVINRVRAAADGPERRHRLFVGPRGAGKTHLISLVHHRVRLAIDDGLRVRLSWLIEDPWEIETYDDLLTQIVESLDNVGSATGSAERRLLQAASDGPIVVLVENLDQILDAIGHDGQRQFRALLENDRPLLLVATATRLSDDLLSQAQPFYGFFDTLQLEPFSVDQAADMLAAIAAHTGNQPLENVLSTPTGHARLSTIAHLAGGQPRVWTLFGSGLTSGGIESMIDMLLERFDDLTPYYQEQLARLAGNERKIVRRLADADRPLTVRELGDLSSIDQRSAAKTISDLRRRGWVRKYASRLTAGLDQRRQYYELAEPLARVAFQMKASRGEPIRMILDFLASWYDLEQISDVTAGRSEAYRLAASAARSESVALAYMLANDGEPARSRPSAGSSTGTVVASLKALDDAIVAVQNGDPEPLLTQPVAVSGLVEDRLEAVGVLGVRLMLARIALRVGGGPDWCGRLHDLIAQASGFRRDIAVVLTFEAEIRRGDDASSSHLRALLDQLVMVRGELVDETQRDEFADEVFASASRLITAGQSRAALDLIEAVEPASLGRTAEVDIGVVEAHARVSVGDLVAVDRYEVLTQRVVRETGAASVDAIGAHQYLGVLFMRVGRGREAVQALEAALDQQRKTHALDAPWTFLTRLVLAEARARTGDVEAASTETESLLTDAIPVLGGDHAYVAGARRLHQAVTALRHR